LRRPTIGQFFAAAAIAVVTVIATAFVWFVNTSRASILHAADQQQDVAARAVEGRVVGELGRARGALDDIEHGIRTGAVLVDDAASLEAHLFTRISGDTHLEEVTFTRAALVGYHRGTDESASIGRSVEFVPCERRYRDDGR